MVRPSRAARSAAAASASVRSAPASTTVAPRLAVRSTLRNGVSCGITMTAGMPSPRAWWATAWAWLPAETAMTPPRAASGAKLSGQVVDRAQAGSGHVGVGVGGARHAIAAAVDGVVAAVRGDAEIGQPAEQRQAAEQRMVVRGIVGGAPAPARQLATVGRGELGQR